MTESMIILASIVAGILGYDGDVGARLKNSNRRIFAPVPRDMPQWKESYAR